MRVFITIDVEFKIGGALSYGSNKLPVGEAAVRCAVDGKSYGLEFLLNTLADNGLQATFFIEALNCIYFGTEPMGKLAREIHEAGQDVQLHLHPCWTYFRNPRWRDALREHRPNDNMAGRTVEDLRELIQTGLDTFVQWRLPRPVALRTGNLQFDRNVYIAMREMEIPIASNIGAGWWRPVDPQLMLYANPGVIEDVLEFPILTYIALPAKIRQRTKILTIAGVSWSEMERLLWQARKAGVTAVTILTHPTEYVSGADDQFTHIRINRLTQSRLRKLCTFLSTHRDEFEVGSMREVRSLYRSPAVGSENTLLSVPLWVGLRGLLENKYGELFS